MYAIAYSPDGSILTALILGQHDGLPNHLAVWRVADYSKSLLLPLKPDESSSICFLPGTRKAVTFTSSGVVSIWDLDRLHWPGD